VEDIRQFVSTLSAEISARLGEGKSVALGIILAESGLAVEEVAADENATSVIDLAITDDAVVAGGVVATTDDLGNVVAEDAEGDIAVEDAEGDIAVEDAEGDIAVEDADGNIFVDPV
jgi:hypothetical protein